MKFRIISSIAIAAVSTLLLGSCNSDPDSAGLEYMPDMYRSAAIEPYVDYGEIRGRENKEVKMLLSAKVPPFGTIPFYGTDEAEVSIMLPYNRKAHTSFKKTHGMFNAELTDVIEYDLAAADVNPLKLSTDNADDIFARGKDLYIANCAHCHGKTGDGNGPMVESGVYAGGPDYANLNELGDGQMFYSIYYGKGMMGAHNSIVNKKEIWTLIHYIRKIQNSEYGKNISIDNMAVVADTVENVVDVNEEHGHH